MAIPINHGQPMPGEGLYTILGEGTEELAGGLWFRLEKIFGRHNEEIRVDLSEKPEYFLAWGTFRRALIAKSTEKEPPAHAIGFKPQGSMSRRTAGVTLCEKPNGRWRSRGRVAGR